MNVKNRFHAFGLHLLGSVILGLCSAALVFLVWYPDPLQKAAGVTHIFLLLVLVDVIVGPVVTLIVFNRAKPELRRDLLIVLLLQLSALGYGMYTVFVPRPVYLVFAADRFDLVYANDLPSEQLAKAGREEFKALPLWGPKVIAARRPDDSQARQELLFRALSGGGDLAQAPAYYVRYDELKDLVRRRVLDLSALTEMNPHRLDDVNALLARYATHPGGAGYLPVRGKVQDLVAVVDRASADIIELVPLNPWP